MLQKQDAIKMLIVTLAPDALFTRASPLLNLLGRDQEAPSKHRAASVVSPHPFRHGNPALADTSPQVTHR